MAQPSDSTQSSGGAAILMRVVLALALLLAVLWAVWGFKDRPLAERPLLFEKGRYLGKPDQPVDPEIIERTRLRARLHGHV